MYTGNNLAEVLMADEVVYVNFNEGIKRVMNNAKLYVKLLVKFRTDVNIEELVTSLSAGDLEKAQGQAHTIKGIAANLSLTELFKQVLELEDQIKAQSANPNQIETVRNVFAATVQEVDKVIAENG
jgi:HPt (histidine-containing phosphotransfer) domain-containing protein